MECKNCKKSLSVSDKFCNNCGAKVIDHRITMGHLATEMKSGFFSIDSSKPVRTFTNMILKPEEVIDGYIGGTRKKFIHAFGYFTIAIILSSFFYFIVQNFFPNAMDAAYELYGANQQAQQEMATNIQKKVFEYQSLLFYILVPIMALMSYVIFYNKRKYNYAEHLILNLYTYSQISIISVLLYFATIWNQTLFSYVQVFSLFLQIGFYSYVVIRVFKLSLKQYILKLLLFLGILFVVYIGAIIIVIVVIIATGNTDMLKTMADQNAAQSISYIVSSTINWTS